MDITYQFHRDYDFVLVELSGLYSFNQFEEFYKKLMSELKEKAISSIIWDARHLNVKRISQDKIRQIVSKIRELSSQRKGGKAAWVVSDELGFGLGRMFEMISEGVIEIEIRVFKNLKEAKMWISEAG